MTLRGRGPWLVSAALHLLALALGLLLLQEPAPQTILRMRFVSSGQPRAEKSSGTSAGPRSPLSSPPGEPAVPAWQGAPPAAVGSASAQAPVSLEELLGPPPVSASEAPETSAGAGWSSAEGIGYAPPPLPPPSLSPPQGARWNLVLTVPGGGGFARAVEGLDSGHPNLDHWLEEYLRTVSFPSSPDGQDYRTRWSLRLESGRPQ